MKKKNYAIAIALILSIAMLAGCAAPAAPATDAAPAPAADTAAAEPALDAAPASAAQGEEKYITEAEAKAIALKDAGFAENEVEFTKCVRDRDDGVMEYEIEFYRDSVEYDYDIDAVTGSVRSSDQDKKGAKPKAEKQSDTAEGDVGRDAAISAALSHAKLSEAEVMYLSVERDRDDGRLEYEVEWRVGNMEYSYEISAADGSVLSCEIERDD